MYRCLMVAFAVAALAGPALAQVTEPVGNLAYKDGPNDKQLHEALPAGAPTTEVSMSCLAGAGRFTDCRVNGQRPPGREDVGAAAVKLMLSTSRFETKDRAGAAVAGRRFETRVDLMAPGDKNPDWLRKPTGSEIGAVLPVRAVREGRDGAATIRCQVTAEGFLDRCTVVSESPEGYGFGASALLLKAQFAMSPRIRGGRATEGGVVTIPIHWTGIEGRGGPVGAGRLALDPNWTVVPSAAAIKAAYPTEAADVASGQAVMRCKLTDKGQASNCSLTSEIPPGKGFGKAARSLTSNFVIQAEGEDAKALKAIQVDIPFRFRNPTASDNGVLTDVRWIRTLSPAGADLLFPATARAEGVLTGVGAVNCAATARGDLTDCNVLREDPPGKGFGAAALEAAKLMQMNPWTKTGDAVEGRRLTLPIRFRMEPPKPAAAAPNP